MSVLLPTYGRDGGFRALRVRGDTRTPWFGGVMSERDDEGQVSEVGAMGAEEVDEPVDDSQGVAGNPDAPDPDEVGEAGPNSNPHAGRSEGDGPR